MNKDHIADKFGRLIELTRQALDDRQNDPIPVVDLYTILPDFWDEWFTELLEAWSPSVRRDLREFFLEQSSLQPGKIAIRYAALAAYSGLIQYLADPGCFAWSPRPSAPGDLRPFRKASEQLQIDGEPEEEPKFGQEGNLIDFVDLSEIEIDLSDIADTWEDHIPFFKQDALLILRFVDVEDLLDWRNIQWEISNSCLFEDWDRASRLYDKTERMGLLIERDAGLLHAQFHFLLAFREMARTPLQSDILQDKGPFLRDSKRVFHPYNWEHQLYDSPDSLSSLLFFASGLVGFDPPEASAIDRTSLHQAVAMFDRASNFGYLPQPYRAALARCYFAESRYADAAAEYERLLDRKLEGAWSRLSSHVYRATATSYVFGREQKKAISTLQMCSSKFPKETDIYLKTAELQAQEADYFGVKETIRRAAENTTVDEDWRYSSLLALGELHAESKPDLSAIRVNPEDHDKISSFLHDYWPRFSRMSDKAQQEWILGTFYSHFLVQQARMTEYLALEARRCFARALDAELLKIFKGIREHYASNEHFQKVVIQASKTANERNQSSATFCQFLDGRKPLTMGQKATILLLCRRPESPVFATFGNWLRSHHPGLLEQADLLRRIANFRNAAEHESMAIEGSEQIPHACRKIIDLIR